MILTGKLENLLKLEDEKKIGSLIVLDANREAAIEQFFNHLRTQQRIVIPSPVTLSEEARTDLDLPNFIIYKIGDEIFYQDAGNNLVRSMANPEFDITSQEPLTWKLTAKVTRGGPAYASVSMDPKAHIYLVTLSK